MKVIVAGGRDIGHTKDLARMIRELAMIFEHINNAPWPITEVVHGGQKGVDTAGYLWAVANGVPHKPFNANWGLYGLPAGPIRNREMAEYADALIIVWNGVSRGSTSMFEIATLEYNLPYHEKRYTK